MCIRSVLFNIVLAAPVCLCGVPSLSAQTPPGNGVPVHTVVTVEPHKGSNPPAISQQDVLVTEGKDHDPVSEWMPAQGDHAALQFFILIDDGANMSLGTEIEALRKFILAQPPTTEIGVAYMENGTAQMAQNLTTDHEAAAKALHLPSGIAGINGSPYFSLSDLIKRWPAGAPRREVLMISDGIDRYYGVGDFDDPYLSATIDDALRAGIIVSAIYTPGLGHFGHDFYMTYWGQLYMARLADQTGGESYYIGFTGAPVSFTPYLDQQSNRLTHQYFLTFLAKPPKKAGLQRVRIATEVPNVDLIAPKRVWVPAP
ncbi:MAG TPA: hypothetical protein VMF10_05880 [Candidatus Aquilonibacter sp.]|nr:hypothetical protein [Candidatus Aquilonibacter sp.]